MKEIEKILHIREKEIYTMMYEPEEGERFPLIVMAHGFDANYVQLIYDIERLVERGYAVFSFDFCGGSRDTKSSGTMREMSVLTEKEDLKDVLEYVYGLKDIDRERIYLFGESQGGYVASITVNEFPWIRGMILYYPAFSLEDIAKVLKVQMGDFPEEYETLGCRVGRIYGEDLLRCDVYREISRCRIPVLIVHETHDPLIPIEYSYKAEKTFPEAVLHHVEGHDHGFYGKDRDIALTYVFDYLERV